MTALVVGAVLLGAAIALAGAGIGAFGAFTVAAAAAALVGFADLLGRDRPRPVVLAAAVGGLGLPIVATLDAGAAWERTPVVVAVMTLAAFLLVLVSGRRADVTAGLGSTVLLGLFVGLGGVSLVALRALPQGFRWVVGLLLFTAVPAAVAGIADLLGRRSLAVPAAVVAAAAVAGGLFAATNPPFGAAAILLMAAAGIGGATVAGAGVPALAGRRAPAALHRVAGIIAGPLAGAPAAYAAARWLTL